MKNLLTISNVRGYIDADGTAQLNLEDVARGLGFTTVAASGNECVRWKTVEKYLTDLSVAGSCNGMTWNSDIALLPEFIPENIFYRLAMKAKNETAEKFQTIVCDEILPAIRKTGTCSVKPLSQLEIMVQSAQALLEHDKQIKQLTGELQGIRDVVTLNSTGWREDSKNLIAKMADKLGGFDHIQTVRKETYVQLNRRIGVDIDRRLLNKRQRMALEGVCKSKCAKVNYLDIIADDKNYLKHIWQ